MKVILVTGKAGSGKDTTAVLLKEMLECQDKKVEILHFADELKKYVADMLKISVEELEELKRNKENVYWYGGNVSIRWLLQYIGMLFREQVDEKYWVDKILEKLWDLEYDIDYVIIPDLRFKNELGVCKFFDCIKLRLKRSEYEKEAENHISEKNIDEIKVDYEIVNDGSIGDLREKLKELLKPTFV